jgi:hypothetical protein
MIFVLKSTAADILYFTTLELIKNIYTNEADYRNIQLGRLIGGGRDKSAPTVVKQHNWYERYLRGNSI